MTSECESDFPLDDLDHIDSDVGNLLDQVNVDNIKEVTENISKKLGMTDKPMRDVQRPAQDMQQVPEEVQRVPEELQRAPEVQPVPEELQRAPQAEPEADSDIGADDKWVLLLNPHSTRNFTRAAA